MDYTFETFPGRTLSVRKFSNVTNADKLLESLKGGLPAAFINPSFVADDFLLLVSAAATLQAQTTSSLITNNIHSELVYRLSASKNISASFRTVGIDENAKELIVAVFDATPQSLDEILTKVAGTIVPSLPFDPNSIKLLTKHYGLTQEELTLGENKHKALVDAISSKIAARHL